ncbi:MAG: pilin [Candidatus Paceibacterota bacterium]
MKKKLVVLSGFVLGLAPVVALAQAGNIGGGTRCQPGPIRDLGGMLCKIGDLLNAVVPILIALGVVYFIWGVVTYVISSDEEAKKAGRNRIIYGIIGLAVIVGLWGLVRILQNTFGIDNAGQNITYPTTPY